MDLEKIVEESRYHEAGHAVAAYYNGFRVVRVAANEEEAITNWSGPPPTTWANCWRLACVTMAGQLADQRGAWGEIRPESWEEFREAAEDALDAGDGERGDHVEILEDLEGMSADGDDLEESYRIVVRDARALVEEHWGEIESVAHALGRTGTLDGAEFLRVMETSAPDREA